MVRTQIAVASGKGGTGKTTVAANLAVTAAAAQIPVQLLDCDVEAPNAHLFLDPLVNRKEFVRVPVPEVDGKLCDACGECGRICRFSAIVSLKTQPLLFPELCHGCGGCMRVCPTGAIREGSREVGTMESGFAGAVHFTGGKLRIGEAMSPPLIRAVRARARSEGLVIVDAPPGTTCPMIEAVRHVDYVLLVTEPTPFGLSDLNLAVETMGALDLPFGVVVNRAAAGRNSIREYCENRGLDLLAEIPDDLRVAKAYSRGEIAVETVPGLDEVFSRLLAEVETKAGMNPSPVRGTGESSVA